MPDGYLARNRPNANYFLYFIYYMFYYQIFTTII